MDKLQVELAKHSNRIKKVVSKVMTCDNVTMTHDHWSQTVHVWYKHDIVASFYLTRYATTKQAIQSIKEELNARIDMCI